LKRAIVIALLGCLAGACLPQSGCATHGTGPYAAAAEGERDTERAQKLNSEAAGIIDKDPAKAEKLLREALSADLYHGAAHNNLGVLYLKQGKLYEAAGEFEWARKLLPGLPDPRMNLALTLERGGRTEDALATYATALEVYPDHLPTMEAMALLQVRAGKTDDRTPHMLSEIALRGEDDRWREWARLQNIRRAGP
jgi:tetratricopeptide (TPR) repeat protein